MPFRAIPETVAKFLVPHRDDLLLERSGGGPDQPVGRIGFIDRDLPGYAFSNFLHLLRPDPNRIHPRYLAWILHRLNQSGAILRLEQQTTQMRNLNFRDYLTIRLPQPPPSEQDGIAQILDSADTAIECTRAAIEKTRRLKEGLIEEQFNAMRTRVLKLGEFITDIRYGTSQASNGHDWGYPTLRIPNIIGGTVNTESLTCVDAPLRDADRFKLKCSDLLLVRTNGNPGYIGRSAVFEIPDGKRWLFASYLIRVRFDDRLVPRFVDEYLKIGSGRRVNAKVS
jgi:type I restriction enzyme S subunit